MAESSVIRTPTFEEAKDFINIGQKRRRTPQELMRKIISEEEQKATKERRPFCRPCAQIDFDLIRNKYDTERASGKGENLEESKKEIDNFDLKKYAKPDYFTVNTPVSKRNVDKSGRVHTEYYYDYKCKKRAHTYSLGLTEEEHNERQKKKE